MFGGLFPENASTLGDKIDFLFYFMTWLSLPLLILVVLIIVFFAIRYRSREGHRAAYIVGFPTYLWTGILIVVLALLELPMDIVQEKVWAQSKQEFPSEKDPRTYVVQLVARQFEWVFRYPGPDGKFGTDDDIITVNNLHVPVGRPVLIKMRSKDVIHSLFIPNMRVKQDVMCGFTNRVWFQATKTTAQMKDAFSKIVVEGKEFPLDYPSVEIACTELCGPQHYRMRGYLIIHTEEELKKWQEKQAQMGVSDKDAADLDLVWGKEK